MAEKRKKESSVQPEDNGKRSVSLKFTPSDFGGIKEAERYYDEFEGIGNKSNYAKSIVIERLDMRLNGVEKEYIDLMNFLKYNNISFKDALFSLQQQKNGGVNVEQLTNEITARLTSGLFANMFAGGQGMMFAPMQPAIVPTQPVEQEAPEEPQEEEKEPLDTSSLVGGAKIDEEEDTDDYDIEDEEL